MTQIQPDNILRGPFWPEKVRVISAKTIGKNQIKIEAVDMHRFYNPILSEEDIKTIEIMEEKPPLFSANGESLFLYLESHNTESLHQISAG